MPVRRACPSSDTNYRNLAIFGKITALFKLAGMSNQMEEQIFQRELTLGAFLIIIYMCLM
jgi:hypothetical protein